MKSATLLTTAPVRSGVAGVSHMRMWCGFTWRLVFRISAMLIGSREHSGLIQAWTVRCDPLSCQPPST